MANINTLNSAIDSVENLISLLKDIRDDLKLDRRQHSKGAEECPVFIFTHENLKAIESLAEKHEEAFQQLVNDIEDGNDTSEDDE